MPLLDVTSVLTDPMFVDRSLISTRQTQVVNDNGLAVNTPVSTPFSGVVTNNTGDTLRRRADGSRIEGSITIHTRFPLQDGNTGLDADLVQWQGRTYTVSNVSDWSRFGRGFVAAICDLIPLSGGPQ
jgi:galactose-6-phosphate isomerase